MVFKLLVVEVPLEAEDVRRRFSLLSSYLRVDGDRRDLLQPGQSPPELLYLEGGLDMRIRKSKLRQRNDKQEERAAGVRGRRKRKMGKERTIGKGWAERRKGGKK
eukprot:755670-Hanusia_phi.AAC.3